jgi:SAF domain
LIISVLVVLVGGLLAFGAGQMLTKHTRVLAVTHDVPVGATIQDSDLTVASVTKDPNLSPIPASQRLQIVGMVAQVGLVKGELLTRAQVGPKSGFTAGQQLVALPLKQGQFPARGLVPGQKVLIVPTPGTAGSAGNGGSSSSAPSSTPGISGTVAEVGPMNQATQITVVDLQVSADSGVAVAQLASTGNLALILLPAGR